MVSGSVATRRSLLQLCQAGCECIHYLVGSHHNSEQGLNVFVRITSWGRIPSLVLTVPDCPMSRVPRLGEHSGCGSCGRQVEMRRMYNRHTIYIRVTCSHIHSIPVQELYSCTHWTYVQSTGKPTCTPHTPCPCPYIHYLRCSKL